MIPDGDWVDVRRPAAILLDAEPWLASPGVALDLACGAGRNALFLAERGWRVLAVDLSRDGFRRLSRRARSRGLTIQPVLADLERFGVRPGRVDLVVNTHFLLRSLFPLIRAALRPGGLLLFETFGIDELETLGGDVRRAYVLERGELPRAFPGFEILLHEEGVFEREEGERGLARLIARKRA
ncbi:MAG: class I SAM-dependent methyltransferase [Gemmatimonadota bacterium]